MIEAKLVDVVHTASRREFAAAIRCVPHDRPARVVLVRAGKSPIIYRFDYSNVGKPFSSAGSPYPFRTIIALKLDFRQQQKLGAEACINLRLSNIAKAILKAPKGLFE